MLCHRGDICFSITFWLIQDDTFHPRVSYIASTLHWLSMPSALHLLSFTVLPLLPSFSLGPSQSNFCAAGKLESRFGRLLLLMWRLDTFEEYSRDKWQGQNLLWHVLLDFTHSCLVSSGADIGCQNHIRPQRLIEDPADHRRSTIKAASVRC